MSAGLYRDQTVRPDLRVGAVKVEARALPFVVFGLLLTLCLSWARLQAVWLDGAFFDSDDAMRLVQVRDFLNGQGWFDLTVKRLAAPEPMIMHWSRIIDVPLAALIRAFALFLTMDSAERAARNRAPDDCFIRAPSLESRLR